MIQLILAIIVVALAVFFLLSIKDFDKMAVYETILSSSWNKQFAVQDIEEKKRKTIEHAIRYKDIPEKKLKRKIANWQKQIDKNNEQAGLYATGKSFSLLDAIVVFGYQIMGKFHLDGNSDLLRDLTQKCEASGYRLLEKTEVTNDKKNSTIYAFYLFGNLFGCCYCGLLLGFALALIALCMENEAFVVFCMLLAGIGIPVLIGYIPYDGIRSKANARQEEIARDFPNVVSKVTLLVTAGMTIVKAMEETASSNDSIIYLELRRTLDDTNRQGMTMSQSLAELQARCKNRFLDKFVTLVTKSYSSGNANLATDLLELNNECWLDKKHSSRRMSETVQNKLFIPTMLMFIGILVVIIIPAISGFSF